MNKSLVNKRKLNSPISLYYFSVVVSYVYYSYKNGYEIHVVNLSYLKLFIFDFKSTLSLQPKRVRFYRFTKLFDLFCSIIITGDFVKKNPSLLISFTLLHKQMDFFMDFSEFWENFYQRRVNRWWIFSNWNQWQPILQRKLRNLAIDTRVQLLSQ